MTDEWLDRRLRVVDEPLDPHPTFAAALYGSLTAELQFDVPLDDRGPTATREPAGRRRARRWWRLLLVAAVVGSAVTTAVGVGGYMLRTRPDVSAIGPAPRVCDLVTPTEIGAIVGAPVALTVPESDATTARFSETSCVYEDTLPAFNTPYVVLSITRYAAPARARAQIEPGVQANGPYPGLGDAATWSGAGVQSGLMVLHGSDVLMVSALSPAIHLDQMVVLARLILARL